MIKRMGTNYHSFPDYSQSSCKKITIDDQFMEKVQAKRQAESELQKVTDPKQKKILEARIEQLDNAGLHSIEALLTKGEKIGEIRSHKEFAGQKLPIYKQKIRPKKREEGCCICSTFLTLLS